ncbi:hypothetical protein Tsubulata_022574 [Turnera subulata]|uniref:Uncharacterized protein n=1 Tax=Turnera subulata TaxID=218843 RepID=A0A9Q0G1P5_9ROSI|nr:hypothetical protein Tsubulata_022574 [Turnera subulata]
MDRGDPVLVPEWLKTGGGHLFGSVTSFRSGDNHARKSSVDYNHHKKRGAFPLERTTSSYLPRNSNGRSASYLRAYSSFGRNRQNRGLQDVGVYNDKQNSMSSNHRHHENSDPLGDSLPSRSGNDMLRRTTSMITDKLGDMPLMGGTSDSTNVNNNSYSNGNGLFVRRDPGIFSKTTLDQEFPSLGPHERKVSTEPVRVSSPGLGSAIQTLPVGMSAASPCDAWKSALVEAPAVVGSCGIGVPSTQQTVSATQASVALNSATGLNLAETLALGPSVAHAPPQTNGLGHGRSDSVKIRNEGRLQVLKPSLEMNGSTSTAKESSKPIIGSKIVKIASSTTPSAAGSSATWSSRSRLNHTRAKHLPSIFHSTVENRPTLQAQSRNDFFEQLKKKSLVNSTSSVSVSGHTHSQSISEKSDEISCSIEQGEGAPPSGMSDSLSNNDDEITHNIGTYNCSNRLEKHSDYEVIPDPDEKEAAFLRSLGWDDTAGDEEGLTEEEISAVIVECMKLKPSLKLVQGVRPAMTVDFHGATSGFGSSN